MSVLSLRDSHFAAESCAQLTRLLALDSVWTGRLDAADAIAGDDAPAIATVGDEMCGLIGKWPAFAGWLRGMVESYDAAKLEGRYDALLSASALKAESLDLSRAIIERRGGIRAYLLESAATLEKTADAEIATIREKIAAIKATGAAAGDIDGGCEAAAGIIGAGLIVAGGPGLGLIYGSIGLQMALDHCAGS